MRTPLDNPFKVCLDDAQAELVRNLASRHNISYAEAIRVCIDHYVILDAERTERHQENGAETKKAPVLIE